MALVSVSKWHTYNQSVSGADKSGKPRSLCLTGDLQARVVAEVDASGDILATRCHEQPLQHSASAQGMRLCCQLWSFGHCLTCEMNLLGR
jgi:hypothetical protein